MRLNVVIPPKWEALSAAETSQIRAETDHLVLHLYCDGSFKRFPYHGGIGLVINFWLPHNSMKQRLSKSCFIQCSFPDDNNTIEAFALAEGAHFALDQVSSLKSQFPTSISSTTKVEVVFWSDSQTVLGALDDPARAVTLPKKMQHVLDIIKLKTRELRESNARVSVKFHWCPEECVEPHAMADMLSKQARMLGNTKYSKAMSLFQRVPHKAIKSALDHPQGLQPPVVPSAQLSSSRVGTTSTTKSAKLAGQQCTTLATTNTDSRRLPYDQSVALRLAMGTFKADPLMMNVLYRDATTSRFFSIVGAKAKGFSAELRSSIHEVIRDQREANKQARWYGPITSDKRGKTYEQQPNLFALIENGAARLPADQEKQVLDAIALQKNINESVLENELANKSAKIVEEVEVEEKPAKIVDELMLIAEPELPTGYETIKEPHRTAEQPTDNTEEASVLEESGTLDGPKVREQPEEPDNSEILEQPQVLVEPEIFERARPNRMRAVWNWLQRL